MLMNKIKRLFTEEMVIVFLTLILLGCSYGSLVYQYLSPPPGKVFLGSVGFPLDFFSNMTVFQAGRDGQIPVTARMTSTLVGSSSYFKVIYSLLGYMSRFFPVNPTIFFHLTRFALSVGLIVVSYWLIQKILPKKEWRIAAFGLAFFSTAITVSRYDKLTDYWTPLAVFNRSAYYQHYLAGFILIILTLIFLARLLETSKTKFLILSCISGFLASAVHPPVTATLLLTFPFYVLAETVLSKKFPLKKIAYLSFFSLVSLIPFYYFWRISNQLPWCLITKVEKEFDLSPYIGAADFFLGIGPTLILGLIGAVMVIRKNDTLGRLLAPWSVVYIIGFYLLSKISGFNSVRFLQTPFFVFLGILSVYPLWYLAKQKVKTFYLLTFLVIFLSLLSFRSNLSLSGHFKVIYPYIFAKPEFVEAVDWLGKNSSYNQIVLANGTSGLLIAALAGNMPYISLQAQQLDYYQELMKNSDNFLKGLLKEKDAREFIAKEGISFVFAEYTLPYSFLKPVFSNSDTIIYSP